MSKVEERPPRNLGKGSFAEQPVVSTPWGKCISYRDAVYYASRSNAVLSAALLQALRIMVPDYQERASAMCQTVYDNMYAAFASPAGEYISQQHHIHPFMRGSFVGGLCGDVGDETLLMYGRVNDFGTYRCEKELDNCPWDICGSELCRATTQSLRGVAEGTATHFKGGAPQLDYHMVEAKGCGDRHCRIVAESREKWPMPEHEIWDCMGPIATQDQIKYTPEEECLSDPQCLRKECDYTYYSGTCEEKHSLSVCSDPPIGSTYRNVNAGNTYIMPTFARLIQEGKLDPRSVNHTIRCVLEASGKAAFGDFYAIKGLHDWIGCPEDVSDGRLMGGYLEIFFQCMGIAYEIEQFNEENVTYKVDRTGMDGMIPGYYHIYLAYWYGMTKSLVSAQWSLWEEGSDEKQVRIIIAKKIDKFC